jgi:hypothetical protein
VKVGGFASRGWEIEGKFRFLVAALQRLVWSV